MAFVAPFYLIGHIQRLIEVLCIREHFFQGRP